MERENIEKIKDRIAKLLRMAQDSSSPNEAAIAASRARSLMDKYQVSEADIAGEIADAFGESRFGRNYVNIPTYINILALAVARFNDVRVIIGRDLNAGNTNTGKWKGKWDHNRHILFRGYANDVALAVAMMDSLQNCMDNLCKTYLLAQGHGGKYPRGIGESFKIGCSSELVNRLNALTTERNELMVVAAQTSPGTSIALINKAKSVDEKFGTQGSKPNKHVASYDGATHHARKAGQAEGRKIQIQHNLGE
jgi:hypothetical protein